VEHNVVTTRAFRSFAHIGLIVAALALAGCQTASEDPTPTDAPSSAASIEPSPSASDASSASAEATPGGDGEGEETSVFDLDVGDCFSADSDQLETVDVVDCEQTHEYETFALIDHEAGDDEPYPDEQELLEYADTICQPPFESFVEHDYQSSIWYITTLTPSEETWADGEREIVCTLNQQDDDQEPISVTGSAEGSGE